MGRKADQGKMKLSDVARLSILELEASAMSMGVKFPAKALDLEKRAMVARRIAGGLPARVFEKHVLKSWCFINFFSVLKTWFEDQFE